MLHVLVCERGSHDKKILADRCPELKDSVIILGTFSREFLKKLCLIHIVLLQIAFTVYCYR